MKRYKIAVLDDYQNVALGSADWSVADRTREPYESLQWPNDRNPIFFKATLHRDAYH